ncbi:MAG: hypothetical protein OJF51_002805 [Nitrospira sp.]|nr:MAG: hypothetical protein OJF51_002805 [Nitrospira sp.]
MTGGYDDIGYDDIMIDHEFVRRILTWPQRRFHRNFKLSFPRKSGKNSISLPVNGCKWWRRETALLFAGQLSATQVVHLTESIAFLAADMSLRYGLAMADAIVYATAKDQEAEVVTGDADLKDLSGVAALARHSRHV